MIKVYTSMLQEDEMMELILVVATIEINKTVKQLTGWKQDSKGVKCLQTTLIIRLFCLT